MLCICSLYSLLNLVVPFLLSATSVLCESAWGLCSEEEKRKCFSLFRLLLADVGCEGVCQWKRLSILCHTGVTGQKWANTPEGLSQLLLPSSLPEQSCSCACACRWSCEGCCAGLLLPCPGRVQAQTWRAEHLQCAAAVSALQGTGRGGWWRGLGDLILSAACSCRNGLSRATAAWALQGGGQEKPARSRLQIIVRSLWSPSVPCWDPGGLTSRVEMR